MKKHIIGLIIFTLIVGTSVIIAGFLGYSPVSSKYSCNKYKHKKYKHKKYKKKQRKHRRHHRRHKKMKSVEATVSQAVFDKRSNNLTASLSFNNDNFDRGEIDLHFFVKDEFGTQYLKKESVMVTSQNKVYKYSFAWLNRLETRENLYVIANVKNPKRGFDYQPKFDASMATPILLKTAE